MRTCPICLQNKGERAYDDVAIDSIKTIYMCKLCDKSMKRALPEGIHVPTALWVLTRHFRSVEKKG
jgi:hypothetical protein